jgi:hypothetical protein
MLRSSREALLLGMPSLFTSSVTEISAHSCEKQRRTFAALARIVTHRLQKFHIMELDFLLVELRMVLVG